MCGQDTNWEANIITDDEEIKEILKTSRIVAVIGIKNKETQPAYFVPKYLKEKGYKIIPINPRLDEVLGEKAYKDLMEVKETIDVVDVFRASDKIIPHAEEALQVKPKVFWMQLGIENRQAAEMLAKAGIKVVMNRCMLTERSRLIR